MPIVDPPWFVNRRHGWGLSPGTWQGWAATALFMVAYVGVCAALLETPWLLMRSIVALLVVFLAIVVATGETPGRRVRRR